MVVILKISMGSNSQTLCGFASSNTIAMGGHKWQCSASLTAIFSSNCIYNYVVITLQ